MADMTDAGNALVSLIASILYPEGTAAPSLTGDRVLVYQGWPDPVVLASDLAAGTIHVSVFPTKGDKVTSISPADDDWDEISNDGATGSALLELRRQTRLFQISIWAGLHTRRDVVATVVDAGLAAVSRMILADGSAAVMTYDSSVQDDDQQQAGIYRRDLLYAVNYATVLTMTEYAIRMNVINVSGGTFAQAGPTFSLPLPAIGTATLPASAQTPLAVIVGPPPIMITPPIASLPAIAYDQGFGPTDASGFVAALPFTPGATLARQVWLNTATGSAAYNGLSPFSGYQMNGAGPLFQVGATGPGAANPAFGPMVDLVTALNSLPASSASRGGLPNQLFCAEGQNYPLNGQVQGNWQSLGSGSLNPACYQSYDPADPLNLSTHGRAGTSGRGARPIWTLGAAAAGAACWPRNSRGDAYDYGGWAFRGLEFYNPTDYAQAIEFVGCQHNMLFENILFDNVELVLQNSNTNAGFWPSLNNLLRFCASYGQYDFGGSHACGVFADCTNLKSEFCIYYHNGWSIALNDRNLSPTAGGPDIFKHSLYVDTHRAGFFEGIGNVMIDASASGLSMRGDHLVHHNVIIDCPNPEIKGGGSSSDTESPFGDVQKSYCQLVLGGSDLNIANPRMQGFSAQNGKPAPDSYCNNSLYANNPGYGHVNNQWLRVANTVAAQPSYTAFNSNRAYSFAPPSTRFSTTASSSGSLTSISYIDYDNISSATSPMTNQQIYAAVGYADKAAMVADMIANPAQPWAYRLLAVAAAGFNFNFDLIYT